MQGVDFGGKHSWWDWHLILSEHPIASPPKPKTKLVDVPGADGSIDLSEILTGRITYEMRTVTCRFVMGGSREAWHYRLEDIMQHLHGRTVKIVLDHDPDYYWLGRAEVKEWNPGQTVAELTIAAKVQPYKVSCYDSGKKVL